MPKTKPWILIFVLLIDTGCALPRFPGDSFSNATKPAVNSEYATVYLYRYGANTPIRTGIVKMYVDGVPAFNAANSSFTWILVKPGLHRFKASWAWHDKPTLSGFGSYIDNNDKYLSIDLQAGKTYYINYRTTPIYGPKRFGQQDVVVSAALEREVEYIALGEMEMCGYLSNSYKS